VRYVQQVIRIRGVAREYWFELLIAFLAIAGMLELIVGRETPAAPSTTLWIALPAVAVLVLPLFARRRFPFAAPAAYWLLAAAISFGDGLLLAFIGSLGIVGLASAFLLGNLRSPLKAGLGLIIVLAGIVIVVYNIPGPQTVGDFVFIPLRFVVAWVAGYALRERAEQAEAAEERAAQAEREREAAARVAVAEERARIARELHDIVAHAVSVMVLQVGAVRHRLPDALAEQRDALRGRRAGRADSARRNAPSPRRDAPRRGRSRAPAPARPRRPRLIAGRD
jgi:signal transduction histidine kinase